MPQYAYKTHPAIHFIKRWVSCGIWRRWGPSNSNYTAVHHSDFFNRSIILCGIREREIKLHNCLVVFSHCMNFSFLSLLDSLTTDCMVIDVLWKSGARKGLRRKQIVITEQYLGCWHQHKPALYKTITFIMRQTKRWMDSLVDRWTNGWVDGQMHRQTNNHRLSPSAVHWSVFVAWDKLVYELWCYWQNCGCTDL